MIDLKVKPFDMTPDETIAWEEDQLDQRVEFGAIKVDPAPFQLVERTSLFKVHSLFSMLGLKHGYVTTLGKLIGVISLQDVSFRQSKSHILH